MSSRPAIIRQRDVTRIIKGAAAAGITYGVIVKDGEARFVPVDEIEPPDAPSAIDDWRSGRAGKAGRRA